MKLKNEMKKLKKLLTEIKELNEKAQENNKWINFEKNCNHFKITDRQKEIIILLSKGLEYKEISSKLNISKKTVDRHIQNIYDKTNTHNKIELINLLLM